MGRRGLPLLGVVHVVLALSLAACWPAADHHSSSKESGVNITGQVTITAPAIQDADVNDPQAPYTPNDSPAHAQTLPNPATVGGYLNLPGRGPNGGSKQPGDLIDIYQVTLSAGQTLTLTASADSATTDLDLLLIDDGMHIIDGSFTVGSTETLKVTEQDVSGTYYVAVVVCGSTLYNCGTLPDNYVGASNYVLTIGGSAPAAAVSSLTLHDDFVADELIVQYHVGAGTAAARQASGGAHSTLLQLGNARRARAARGAPDSPQTTTTLHARADLQDKLDTLMSAKSLQRDSGVALAEPNYRRTAFATANDTYARYQWDYDAIHLAQAWDITKGYRGDGQDVIVAVVDTGILPNHPDLAGKLVPGYDFIKDSAVARDGDGIDADPTDAGDKLYGTRSSFHGTHVAGTIAAATNNGQGVSGISWGAKIMPLRVLGQGGGTSYDVQQAVLFAAGLDNDSGTRPARRADIINLSLGGGSFSQSEQQVFSQARAAGVIVVAAAGNESSDTPSYPAAYSGVISVSALDAGNALAPYSNFGATIDVAAPGGNLSADLNGDGYGDGILSTSANDGSGSVVYTYAFMSGTSMATPHVAGVLALMKAVNPSLTPENIDALLASGALTQDLGTPGRDDDFGYGLIDAYKAVIAATSVSIPATPQLVVAPTRIHFGVTESLQTLALNNVGGGVLQAQLVRSNASWLTLKAYVDADGLGTYTVSASRNGLSAGTYSTTLSVSTTAGAVEIPVSMQVGDATELTNPGYAWVVLVDAATQRTVATTAVRDNGNGYAFNLSHVPPGSYYLFAGSDLDNDEYVCGAAETCGAYGDLQQPLKITVGDNNVTTVNVSIGLNTPSDINSLTQFALPKTGVSRVVGSTTTLSTP